ncbi:MAG TPA: MerR family transcriptional regulator [Stellaceae bacterium]|nr:MerR family transcriptional regulator [Stellaceae bacterium]
MSGRGVADTEVHRADETETVRRSGKSASAFWTTGEVAEELGLPAHVLRFWESKFPQVKPLKRGGGRRYYRPEDVNLLRRIRECLYQQGYTIRGVQKLLREGALRGDEPAPSTADEEPPSTLFALEPVANNVEPANSAVAPSRQALRDALEEVRRELVEIRALLEKLASS